MNLPGIRCGETTCAGLRGRAKEESGQVLVLAAVMMGMLLVCVGLVVDVGHAMLVQRQLQAGVDAAALAGVQHLPDKPLSESVAMQYSPTPTNKNAVNTVDNAVTTATVLCLNGVPGCSRRDGGVNGIVVSSTSSVPTWFGRIIGLTKLKVSAKATACAPCSVKPLDIMVVLDRTGSMCAPTSCAPGNLSDLHYAKEGIETFAEMLDPSLDKLGLALFPPVLDQSWRSSCPSPNGYRPWTGNGNLNPPPASLNGKYYGYEAYWPHYVPDPLLSDAAWYTVASLEGADGTPADDYLVDVGGTWLLNDGTLGTPGTSAFLQRLGCAGGNGTTSYALSIEEAKYELGATGRGNVQDVIIFLSDGAANTSPQNVNTGHWTSNGCNTYSNCPSAWKWRPCGSGVESATRIKPTTLIYTIGYDLDAGTGAPEKCRRPNSNGQQNGGNPVEAGCGTPPSGWGDATGCHAYNAIRAMATDPDGSGPLPPNFYNKPNAGQLNDIFRAIALDLAGSRGRLIDNTIPNLIS